MVHAKRSPHVDDAEVFVPRFELTVDGSPVSSDVASAISEIVYRDSLEDISSLEFVISDWDPESRRFIYSDGDDFLPGKRLRAAFGYHGNERPVALFDGRIAYLQPDFPGSSQPQLIVGALDLLHDLRTEQRTAVYENKTDAEIAREIANRIGVDVDTSTSGRAEPRHAFLFQRNQYDVIFLRERARALGYELTVSVPEGSGRARLRFGPSYTGDAPEYRLIYGRSLLSFRASLDVSRQVSRVVVRTWDGIEKQMVEAESSGGHLRAPGTTGRGGSTVSRAYAKRREVVVDTPVDSMAEAESLARAVREDIVRGGLIATAETIGLPHLRAGRRVVLEDLGGRFSGTYFITASRHSIGSRGYDTRFDCRMEERA